MKKLIVIFRRLAAFSLLALVAAFGIAGKPAYAADREILFFCGSAVKVPMDEIIRQFERDHRIKVSVIYGGSGTLLSQMALSRRGDLYLAGSPDFITLGEKKGLLIPETRRMIAYLVPAIIVQKGNPHRIRSLEDLATKKLRLGIGNPESVCLGLYAIELLAYNGLLEKALPRVTVFAKSCEDTANLMVLRKVDAILGWDVFASWNPKDVDWIRIRSDQIPRLSYIPLSVPVSVRDRRLTEQFISFILSRQGRDIFRKWGYILSESEACRHAPRASIGGDYTLPVRYYRLIGK